MRTIHKNFNNLSKFTEIIKRIFEKKKRNIGNELFKQINTKRMRKAVAIR